MGFFRISGTLLQKLLPRPKLFDESKRTTYVFRRKFTPLLNELGSEKKRKLRRKDYYYQVIGHVSMKKARLVDVVLLEDVHRVGNHGDLVNCSYIRAYEHYILPKVGVQATPEIIQEVKLKTDANAMPALIKNLICDLQSKPIPVFMSAKIPWVLEKWHIRVSLRRFGIMCPEELITIPEVKVSGPNYAFAGGEFEVKINIENKYEESLACRLFYIDDEDNDEDGIAKNMIKFHPNYHLEPSTCNITEEIMKYKNSTANLITHN